MEKKIKVRSIIFTEACPLACRYCDLKHQSTSEWGLSKKSASEWISGRRE